MTTFVLEVSLFLLGGIVHIAVWWIRPPENSGKVLSLIFLFSILAGLGGAVALSRVSPQAAELLPTTVAGWIHTTMLAFSITAAYVMTYPAIEVESPTLVIIAAISRAGEAGLPKDKLYSELSDEVLVLPRVQDLLDEHMAVLEDGRYRATSKGHSLAKVFGAWRRLLRAPKGG